MNTFEPVLYVVARNDLDSLNPGKLAAQVAHAATALAEEMYKRFDKESLIHIQYQEWIAQAGTFGTTIVLQADKEWFERIPEIDPYVQVAYGDVIDPTYPFITNKEYFDLLRDKIVTFEKIDENKYFATRREHTCSYFFGAKNVASQFVTGLSLYK